MSVANEPDRVTLTARVLKSDLTCPVCFDFFREPVTLHCGAMHTLCSCCFASNNFVCPLCQKPCNSVSNVLLATFMESIAEPTACGLTIKRAAMQAHTETCVTCAISELKQVRGYASRLQQLARKKTEAGRLRAALPDVSELFSVFQESHAPRASIDNATRRDTPENNNNNNNHSHNGAKREEPPRSEVGLTTQQEEPSELGAIVYHVLENALGV